MIFDWYTNQDLERDMQTVLAELSAQKQQIQILLGENKKIMATLQDILNNDAALSAAFNQLKTDMEASVAALQAEIATLTANQVDTTKLAQIANDQAALLGNLQSLDSEAVSDNPNTPAPAPSPAPASEPEAQ